MRLFTRRLAAYILSGMAMGAAGWLLICQVFVDSEFTNTAIAVACLLLGIVAAFLLLRKPAIREQSNELIISQGQILASDLTCITAATVAAFFVVDGFSKRFLGIEACITEPLVADIIALMFVPVAAVLALFVTQTAAQRFSADLNGITLEGFSGSIQIPWEDIISFCLERQNVLVGRVGLLVPRHLRTNIFITLRNGDSARIFDPGISSARRAVIEKLQSTVPHEKRGLLKEVEAKWV